MLITRITLVISALMTCVNSIFATSQPHTFIMHRNDVFVETGALYGDGILNALMAGFKEIHSIELSPKYYKATKDRFKPFKNIHVHRGDSGENLFDVIKEIKKPITFWLDAQYSGWDMASNGKLSPILQELDQIKNHPIKNHTILIDDVRLFGTWEFDFVTKKEIIEKIYEINPNYEITYIDGHEKNDILVATPKKPI